MTDKNENARDKFFSALNAEAHNKMMAVFEEAFSDHDVVPEAIANGQGRDNPATPDHVGTGNTPEPVAWMAHSGDSRYVAELKEMAAAAAAEFNWDLAPLYLSPALTADEREAVEWAAIRSDADAQMIGGDFYLACQTMRARSATLRTLLERLT